MNGTLSSEIIYCAKIIENPWINTESKANLNWLLTVYTNWCPIIHQLLLSVQQYKYLMLIRNQIKQEASMATKTRA